MKLSEFISANEKTILLDGATGTQLAEAGLEMGGQTNLTHPDAVSVIDVLHGFEQDLVTSTEDGNLVINNLLVKDYPIFLRLNGQ